MTKRTFALLAMLGVGFSLACNNRTDAPPEFNAPMTTADGATLMPIRIAKHEKAGAGGGVASTETPAAGSGTAQASAEGAVTIDDSTPEAVAQTLIKILETGSIAQLPEVFVPEQKAAIQPVVDALLPVIEGFADLKKAVTAKFPDDADKMPDMAKMLASNLPQDVTITDIQTTDDDAEGKISSKQPNGEQKTGAIKFKRIDGKWRIGDSDVSATPSAEELEKVSGALKKAAEALKAIAQRINDGEFKDSNAAGAELLKTFAAIGAEMGGMGGAPDAGSGDKSADTKEEKPADSANEAKPAKPRKSRKDEPDPLDGTVPAPGVLPRG